MIDTSGSKTTFSNGKNLSRIHDSLIDTIPGVQPWIFFNQKHLMKKFGCVCLSQLRVRMGFAHSSICPLALAINL